MVFLSQWIDRCEIAARNYRNSPYSEDKVNGLKTIVEATRIQSSVFGSIQSLLANSPQEHFLKNSLGDK